MNDENANAANVDDGQELEQGFDIDEGTADAEPTEDQNAAPEEGTPDAEDSSPPDNANDAVSKRIGKITAEKHAKQRRIEALETQVATLEGAKVALPTDAPKLEDFDYDDEKFNEATIDYRIGKQLEERTNVEAKTRAAMERKTLASNFDAKEAEYAAANPKYFEAVESLPRFQEDTLDVIYKLGPETAQFLGENEDVALEVATASPVMAAARLGQIAAGLNKSAPQNKSPSSAPDPVETLGGGSSSLSSDEGPEGATYE